MNKYQYKVIFSKHRSQFVVVAENIAHHGSVKASTQASKPIHTAGFLQKMQFSVLAFSVMLMLGTADFVQAEGIHADSAAPQTQQPTIQQTANGTPQVNVQTPTQGGVSMNQYTQFDVGNKGAILNNSSTNVQTQIGGQVQGNPALSNGAAKVIVNQVNSANPSQLHGYIEVAGRRAEVVVANPSGIQVNGGGFINAAGVTLTTGKPQMNHGYLEGYVVRGGNIAIQGQGLDTKGSDYTHILAKAAQINAGIWAKDLKVVTGSNQTDIQGSLVKKLDAANTPAISIDTSSLGGMYAGKIALVSTDKGVGVHHVGKMYADAGDVSVDVNGHLTNSGSIQGNKVNLSAKDQIQFDGGSAKAHDLLSVKGEQIILSSTTVTNGNTSNGKTVVDHVADLSVTGTQNGVLSVEGAKGITANGAVIQNAAQEGKTLLLSQKGSVNLGTIDVASHEKAGEHGDKNHKIVHQTAQVGTTVAAAGDIIISAKDQANLHQTEVRSNHGSVTIIGANGVNVTAGKQTLEMDQAVDSVTQDKQFGAQIQTTAQYQHQQDKIVSSNVIGQNMTITSDKNVLLSGSHVIADHQLNISAKHDVNMIAAGNHDKENTSHETRTSWSAEGGKDVGSTIGSKKETTDTKTTSVHYVNNTAGSINGDTLITAGDHYQQIGSTVSSAKESAVITAKTVNIWAAQDSDSKHNTYTVEQKETPLAVHALVMNDVQSSEPTTHYVGESKYSSINFMALANHVMENNDQAKRMMLAADPSLSDTQRVDAAIGYISQKRKDTSSTEKTRALESNVSAGNQVHITAAGAGKQSNIAVVASNTAGKGGTVLSADNAVLLSAGQQTNSARSENRVGDWHASLLMNDSEQSVVPGVDGGSHSSKGHDKRDDVTYRHTHVGNNSSQTVIHSHGDTNMMGADVIGKSVNLTAANLTAESLQNTSVYDSKNSAISAKIAGSKGLSGSGGYSKSNIDADYTSVTEQSGMMAGNDGYHVNVTGNTDLKGALITSTQTAEDAGKNSISTGSLTYSDVQNHTKYSADSFEGNVNGTFNGGWSGKTVDKNGHAVNAIPVSVGFGHDKDDGRSVTHSGVNTSNITITDKRKQQQLTGKKAEQVISEIHTDAAADNNTAAGYLNNNFDKDRVLKELNVQVKVTKEFNQNSQKIIDGYVLPKQEALVNSIAELNKKQRSQAVIDPEIEKQISEKYNVIYKLRYEKKYLETLVEMIAANPDVALTQGMLATAATKLRKISLDNSRLFEGIRDGTTGKITYSNVSYASGYFDGVKLGGVRVSLDTICGKNTERCTKNPDGTYVYINNKDPHLKTLTDAVNPAKNPEASALYGATGGFQATQGELFGPYKIGSIKDLVVESFAGPHDYLGGQMWGWYDEKGNTTRGRDKFMNYDEWGSTITAIGAIPVSAPFALADLLSPQMVQLIAKIISG